MAKKVGQASVHYLKLLRKRYLSYNFFLCLFKLFKLDIKEDKENNLAWKRGEKKGGGGEGGWIGEDINDGIHPILISEFSHNGFKWTKM